MAMNGRVDFPKKKLAHQWPGSALGRPEEQGGSRWGPVPLHAPHSPIPNPPHSRIRTFNSALLLVDSELTRGVGYGVPRVLGTSAGAVAGRGAQASWEGEAGQPQGLGPALGGAGEGLLTPIVVMGSHERAAGRNGCHASRPRRCGEESRMWVWLLHTGVYPESPRS